MSPYPMRHSTAIAGHLNNFVQSVTLASAGHLASLPGVSIINEICPSLVSPIPEERAGVVGWRLGVHKEPASHIKLWIFFWGKMFISVTFHWVHPVS